MAIPIGTVVGSYEITALIGKGGMGEVYRARDSKLKREVAIKTLPEEFALDADRVSRFVREAEVVASLSHPNIGAVYGLEESGTSRWIVMELVEGETLAELIRNRSINVSDALDLARQIAQALESAHEKGVVHRDLKPANIKLTPDGTIKILDFGLAKALQPRFGSDLSNSPTFVSGSVPGAILGTAPYMAPEQARGLATDHRADIFAFGCVLFEMLTGKQAFSGETASDTLVSVLSKEPAFSDLPASLDSRVQELLRRSLQKNLKQRWQSAGDVRIEIEKIQSLPESNVTASPASSRRTVLIMAGLTIVAFVLGFGVRARLWRAVQSAAPVTRLSFSLPQGSQFTNNGRPQLAISVDGTKIVYVADSRLYLRVLDGTEARPIEGTNDPIGVTTPLISPDGRWVAFATQSNLFKTPITGGKPVTLSNENANFGASWGAGNEILFATSKGIWKVSGDGGESKLVIPTAANELMYGPQALPDGDHILFSVTSETGGQRWDKGQIVVQSRSTGNRTTLVNNATDGRYVDTGYLVYRVAEAIYAIAFDAVKLQTVGVAAVVLDGVGHSGPPNTPHSRFAFSGTGTMAFIEGGATARVGAFSFMDLEGRSGPSVIKNVAGFSNPRISPDGKQVVFIHSGDAWVSDVSGKTDPRRLTFDQTNQSMLWAPDSSHVAFWSTRPEAPGIYIQPADGSGTATLIVTSKGPGWANLDSWSRDGRTLFWVADRSVWSFTLGDAEPKRLIESTENYAANLSPNGRWLAYTARAGDQVDVFVQPYPVTGARYQISTGGGYHPVWSPDGKRLYYIKAKNQSDFQDLMMTEIQSVDGPAFAFGPQQQLAGKVYTSVNGPRAFDIAPDGKHFLVWAGTLDERTSPPPIWVVSNWFQDLRQRVAAAQK